MKHCHNCEQKIAFGGYNDGQNDFCSKQCAEDYDRAKKGFCEKCINETTDDSPGEMQLFNRVGTGWGPFSRKKCSQCGSVIKTKWIYLLWPIIPRGKYRVLYIKRTAGFTDRTEEFLARKIISEKATSK